MKITFREINHDSDSDYNLLAKWDNDPAIRHLSQHFPDEASFKVLATVDSVKRKMAASSSKQFMVCKDQIPVGNIGFCIDFEECVTKLPFTAWLGIIIGEESARGKGIGTIAMKHLESQAIDAGAKRFELGVFEFNTAAINLYEKLGYREIKRIQSFTYWNGRMWDDIRFLKEAT